MTQPKALQAHLVLPRLPQGKNAAKPLSVDEAVAILKVAFLAGEADGRVADEEEDAFTGIARGLQKLTGKDARMEDAALDKELDALTDAVEKKGREPALKGIAAALTRPLARDVAYKVAVAMSLADLDKNDDEEDFDDDLIAALRLSEEQADLLAQDVYAAVDQGD